MRDNGSDPSSSSESESDSEDSEVSQSNGDEDANVQWEDAARRSQSPYGASSGDDEVDGRSELEGRDNSGDLGDFVPVRNSEDIATVVDREPTSIDSVSVHQNHEMALTYKGWQGNQDLETSLGEQGSTDDGIPDSAGPNIIEETSAAAVESAVIGEETGRSKRKRVPTRQEHDISNACLCGEVVDPSKSLSGEIIKCREVGCETEWVSSNHIYGLYHSPCCLVSSTLCGTRNKATKMALLGVRGLWANERREARTSMMSYFLI